MSKISFEIHIISFYQMEEFLLGVTLAHGRKTKIEYNIPHMPSQNSLKYSYLERQQAYLWCSCRININLVLLIKN